ncbi:hypothetical protein N1851_029031 [Merluccius polli]|uniref:Uncharacterized protein n=1 Tax=Merluccius polli TaxID=89951 RepID=A0AA47M7M7_MERPO|nr:hypothetical protein N1851_029031 [Merluccius polli]
MRRSTKQQSDNGTCSLSGKWQVFEEWCGSRHTITFQCSVVDLLCFLQELVDKGKAFSTIKGHLASISAYHVGFGDKLVGQHPLVCRFMKGACHKLPVSRPLVPLWDLLAVLDALSHHPSEPIEAVGMKFFAPGLTKVYLRPNQAFVPGWAQRPDVPQWSLGFFTHLHSPQQRSRGLTHCLVRALHVYGSRTAGFRKEDQLFVSYTTPHKGKPLSRQRMSH